MILIDFFRFTPERPNFGWLQTSKLKNIWYIFFDTNESHLTGNIPYTSHFRSLHVGLVISIILGNLGGFLA